MKEVAEYFENQSRNKWTSFTVIYSAETAEFAPKCLYAILARYKKLPIPKSFYLGPK